MMSVITAIRKKDVEPEAHSYQRIDYLILFMLVVLSWATREMFWNSYLIGGDPENRLVEASLIFEGRLSDFRSLSERPMLYSALIGLGFVLMGAKQWIVAKHIALFFSILLPPLSYSFAKEMTRNRVVAVVVGIWMAFSPLMLENSSIIAYQGQYAFFSLLSLLFLLRFQRNNQHRTYATALFLGLLAWSTYSVGIALVFAVYVAGTKAWGKRIWPYLLAGLLVKFLMGFELFPGSYQNDFMITFGNTFFDRLSLYVRVLACYPFKSYLDPLGIEVPLFSIFLFLAGIVPVALSLMQNLLIAMYLVVYLLPFLVFFYVNPAYMIPVFPVLAASWLSGVQSFLSTRFASRYRMMFGTVIAGIIIWSMLSSSWFCRRTKTQEYRQGNGSYNFYNHNVAKEIEWINQNIPKGSSINFCSSWGFYWFYQNYFRFFLGDAYDVYVNDFETVSHIKEELEKGNSDPFYDRLLNKGEYLAVHLGNSNPDAYDPVQEPYLSSFVNMARSGGFAQGYEIQKVYETTGVGIHSQRRAIIFRINKSGETNNGENQQRFFIKGK